MANDIDIIIRLKAEIDKQVGTLKKNITDVKKNISGTNQTLTKFSGQLKTVAAVGFGALSVAVGKAVFDAQAFEKSLANVFTLLDKDTLNKFGGDLESGALRAMEKFGFSIEETNQALFDTISAGVPAGQAIEFLNVSSRLAVGGVTSVATATDGLTSVINAYGKETIDATTAANVFFVAQKAGKTDVEQLANNIGKVAPIASAAGLSFQETASALATLTAQGINTDIATTGLKSTISSLIKVTPQSQKEFDKLGIALKGSNGELRPFGEILKDVQTSTGGNTDALAKLFPNVESLNTVLALTKDGLVSYNDTLNATLTDTESLDAAFKTQQATFSQQFKVFQGTIRAIGIELGNKILPILSGLLGAFNNLGPGVKRLIIFGGGLVAVLITLGAALGVILPLIGTIGAGLGVLAAGFAIVASPVGLLVIGIAALVAGSIALVKNFGKLKSFALDTFTNIRVAFNNFLIGFLEGVQKLANVLNKLPGVNIDVTGAIENLDALNAKLNEQKTVRAQDIETQKQEKLDLAATDKELKDQTAVEDIDRQTMLADTNKELKDKEVKDNENARQLDQKSFAAFLQNQSVLKAKQAQDFAKFEDFIASASNSKNKEVAAVAKGLALFKIGLNTAEAATAAYKSLVGIPVVGPALAVGAAAAAVAFGAEQAAAVTSAQPALQDGGIARATPGGQSVTVAEGGSDEAIIPLDEAEGAGGIGGDLNVQINMDGRAIMESTVENYNTAKQTGILQIDFL